MVAIKICGLRDINNIAEVASLKPEYLGFICWEGSQRFIASNLNKTDLDRVAPGIERVGVFVNQSVEQLKEYIEKLGLTIVQLHGDETPEFCKQLRSLEAVKEIWKAIPIESSYPKEQVERYQSTVDRILFDTASFNRGGSGVSFSWDLIASYQSSPPLVLSGGLGLDNIADTIRCVKTYSCISVLDYNSKLEVKAGVKDREKVFEVLGNFRKEH